MNGMQKTGTSYFSFVYLGTESVKRDMLAFKRNWVW